MKTKLFLVLLFAFSLPMFYGFTKENYANNKANEEDLLTAYGKYLYKREKCEQCHALEIGSDHSLVLLDGLSKKWTTAFMYFHLLNASKTNTGTTMPSFEHLGKRFFNRDSLNQHLTHCTAEEWALADSFANELVYEIRNEGFEIDPHVEGIALLKYLKSIPESETAKSNRLALELKLKQDSIRNDSIWANSNATILATINNRANVPAGKAIFEAQCVFCHGNDAKGMNGPNLTDTKWIHGASDLEITNTIINGVFEKGMLAFKNTLSPEEVGQVVAYLKSLSVAKK